MPVDKSEKLIELKQTETSPVDDLIGYDPDLESINQFIFLHFPGFDLHELLTQLEDVAVERSFTWTKRTVKLSDDGRLTIHHESYFSPESLSLKRVLMQPAGDKRVVHEEMIIPAHLQKKGLSRKFMLPYYEQYQKSGVDRISVYAAMKRGGYAWAKYGFAATNYNDVFRVLDEGYSKGILHDEIQELRSDANSFYIAHGYSTPFPIYLWAEATYGELLLTDSDWQGELNFNDSDQVDVFRTYLYQA